MCLLRQYCNPTAVEQIIGREGETATLLFSLSAKLERAWWRFRPTSSQPLGGAVAVMVSIRKKWSGLEDYDVML